MLPVKWLHLSALLLFIYGHCWHSCRAHRDGHRHRQTDRHTHTHTHTRAHAHTNTHTHAHTHTNTHVHTRTYIQTRARIHEQIHIHNHTCTNTNIKIRMRTHTNTHTNEDTNKLTCGGLSKISMLCCCCCYSYWSPLWPLLTGQKNIFMVTIIAVIYIDLWTFLSKLSTTSTTSNRPQASLLSPPTLNILSKLTPGFQKPSMLMRTDAPSYMTEEQHFR